MLKAYAHQFCQMMAALRDISDGLEMRARDLDPDEKGVLFTPVAGHESIRMKIGELRSTAQIMRLRSVIKQADRIDELLTGTWNPRHVQREVEKLSERLEDELEYEFYFHVPVDLAPFYDDFPFGDAVADRFPAAIDDMESAGKCLALDQPTASVFHLMRVMEVGLKVIAIELGIPYAPSWESYLKQISSRIEQRHADKSDEWKAQEPLFRDVMGDLQAIKIAWRNPTMHVVKRYTSAEAKDIYAAVKAFMTRLTDHLPDTGPA